MSFLRIKNQYFSVEKNLGFKQKKTSPRRICTFLKCLWKQAHLHKAAKSLCRTQTVGITKYTDSNEICFTVSAKSTFENNSFVDKLFLSVFDAVGKSTRVLFDAVMYLVISRMIDYFNLPGNKMTRPRRSEGILSKYW